MNSDDVVFVAVMSVKRMKTIDERKKKKLQIRAEEENNTGIEFDRAMM